MSRLATVKNFLRIMGAIYTIAFVSFGLQAAGLVGSHGILPAATFLAAARQALGWTAWWYIPTVLWLRPADWAVAAIWIVGAVLGIVAAGGWLQRGALAGCWLLWLSICSIGQDFLSFQWDMLLLETGFLAIFAGETLLPVWLFRLLTFRLMFSSGVVKLASGDPVWRDLTAMGYHYETQPLPTPLAWWMYQLPGWFQRCSTALVLVIELAVPFLFFLPRRLRVAGAWITIGLQALILLTGNYAYFNWLTIALCLWLFFEPLRKITWGGVALAIPIGLLTLVTFGELLGVPVPDIAGRLVSVAGPLRIVNSYGLFAVMTTTRPEIQVEGSNDGENWLPYEFRYKPGDVHRAPPIVAPHQPRLDWQMWFAALGSYQQNRWFVRFLEKLLRGEPAVLRLLRKNPFPGTPPRYVRARLFQYHFTRLGQGWWWRREEQGMYFPPASLH
ncbi:MAG TPA: lipase maturation factor family protein [Candidatus Acidoferrales bacterium]|nr:lipase maturation factor family protein [Candidatus Acidoferrales bacterium]